MNYNILLTIVPTIMETKYVEICSTLRNILISTLI